MSEFSPITTAISIFNLKKCRYVPNNQGGYYFIDDSTHALFTTTTKDPFIEELPYKTTESIASFCFDQENDLFIYTTLKNQRVIIVKYKDTILQRVECNEDVKGISLFQSTVVAITETFFYYFDIKRKSAKSMKHKQMSNWKWTASYIVLMTQTKKQIIFSVFEVCDTMHFIQDISFPISTTLPISFDLATIFNYSFIFAYEPNAKSAIVIRIGPQNDEYKEVIIPVYTFAQVAVVSDFLLVMTFSIGVVYYFSAGEFHKVAVVKLPPLSQDNIRFNQSHFLNFNERSITTFGIDFSAISSYLPCPDRTAILLKHHSPVTVIQQSLSQIFDDFYKGHIPFETIRKIFSNTTNTEIISSALLEWHPDPPVFCFIVLEFINSCPKKIPAGVFIRYINELINDNQITRLLMMLQCHVIPDDEVIALHLVSNRDKCDFLFQFALDMLKRMKNKNTHIFETLIIHQEYADALMFAITHNVDLKSKDISDILRHVKDTLLLFQLNQFLMQK
ncbi:hypothetical protein EIN_098450 [Entamoeba invadens IP1]|uniref:Mic1 domain-containing protein n=1 Tax=Entamoeba invadens IP1 TaxID=370355 RepID=A0A0A1U477_ENTIV|nr:hypothetical protein EIN_098450 [Entamoeba invadens IP1]ELP87518.1 hypothetical protein EIN_098450 [Entamoeba invadens IP1]|eukprot:XP_004254289.1 hypothetical protein EIN_098450 [Entamoeba invadens IP1]